jgi:Tat protein translocase TatB subunit
MSLGPAEILIILFVALIAFGPQRLPEVARQIGSAMRELRRMQDQVRGELEQVIHPDFVAPAPRATAPVPGDTDHAAFPANGAGHNGSTANGSTANGSGAASDMTPYDMRAPGSPAPATAGDDDVTDDGFAGPRTFA